MRRQVISDHDLPMRAPLALTIGVIYLLDRLQAADWLNGACAVLLALIWLGFFIELWTRIDVRVLKELKDDKG